MIARIGRKVSLMYFVRNKFNAEKINFENLQPCSVKNNSQKSTTVQFFVWPTLRIQFKI